MVTSFDEPRSAPGGASGRKCPTSFGANGSAIIDDAQPLREPGKRNDGAGEALGRLMAAGHRRLRAAVRVEPRHLERRDRDRQLLSSVMS